MRTRGPDKVMFASDHPLLEIDKCVGDLNCLDLPPEILASFAAGNAERVFFRTR
jgi:predicted TIM-barrel fold metal-dependent hydrolase